MFQLASRQADVGLISTWMGDLFGKWIAAGSGVGGPVGGSLSSCQKSSFGWYVKQSSWISVGIKVLFSLVSWPITQPGFHNVPPNHPPV